MSKEKIIVHVECPTGHLSHAVNVRRDKEPPAQLGGGVSTRRSLIQLAFRASSLTESRPSREVRGVPMGPSEVRWTSESSNS